MIGLVAGNELNNLKKSLNDKISSHTLIQSSENDFSDTIDYSLPGWKAIKFEVGNCSSIDKNSFYD